MTSRFQAPNDLIAAGVPNISIIARLLHQVMTVNSISPKEVYHVAAS
jgi:hypothetical protein